MIKLLLADIDGTMTDGGYYVSSVKGEPHEYSRKFNTRDFVGLEALERGGIKVAVITGARSPCKAQFDRAAPFMTVYSGIQQKYEFVRQVFVEPMYDEDDKLIHGFPHDLDELSLKDKFGWSQIAFIGDELNDAMLLKHVGLAACPADAVSEVIDIVSKHENGFVLAKEGGRGCVREFTDIIRKIMDIPACWEDWKYE